MTPKETRCSSYILSAYRRSAPERALADSLWNFPKKLAKEQGCRAVRLDTYEGNAPAASLLYKNGFTFVGSEDFNFQNVIMERLICFDKVIE